MISLGENVFSLMHFQIAEEGRFELFASVSTTLPNPVHFQVLVSIGKTDKKIIFNFETSLSPRPM